MPVEQAGKIWRITGIKSFKGEGGNFKLDLTVHRELYLSVSGLCDSVRVCLPIRCINTGSHYVSVTNVTAAVLSLRLRA